MIDPKAIEAAKKWLYPDEPVSARFADEACRELLRLADLLPKLEARLDELEKRQPTED